MDAANHRRILGIALDRLRYFGAMSRWFSYVPSRAAAILFGPDSDSIVIEAQLHRLIKDALMDESTWSQTESVIIFSARERPDTRWVEEWYGGQAESSTIRNISALDTAKLMIRISSMRW